MKCNLAISLFWLFVPELIAGAAISDAGRTVAPEGCLKLASDTDWPSPKAWQDALPGVIPRDPKANGTGPDYRIRPKSVEEIQRALKFIKDNNIRVSIVASGHDGMARSTAASGLLIDVSLLQGIRVYESFEPTARGADSAIGAKSNTITPKDGVQAAVTIAAGTTAERLYKALSESKLLPMTAAHAEVTVVGGWGQFGGHGPQTHKYGLGVDQWLEAKVVTADGELKVANKVTNSDLFWAIRGSGGGNFGVVVEATIKAHPDIPITVFNWWLNSTNPNPMAPNPGFRDATAYLLSQLPVLHAKGVGGHVQSMPGALRGFNFHSDKGAGTANANAVWKPVLEKLQSFPGLGKFQTRPYNFKNFEDFYNTAYGHEDEVMTKLLKRHGPGEAGAMPNNYGVAPMSTRLLGPAHLKSPKLVDYLIGPWIMAMVAPMPGVGEPAGTSVLPAWYNSTVHYISLGGPSVSAGMGQVRALSPESGAYGNEADPQEPDWQTAFWGSNYARLSELKRKYDPKQVFWVSPGINADHMKVVDKRLCKTQPPKPAASTAPVTDNATPASMQMLLEKFSKTEMIGDFPSPGNYVGLQQV